MNGSPDAGDVVDIQCDPACEGEFKYHGIQPLANKLRGVVMETEMPYTEDHIYRVRFFGPEWTGFESRPGMGVCMYFKTNELTVIRKCSPAF